MIKLSADRDSAIHQAGDNIIIISVFSAILTLGFGHGSNNDAPYLQRSVTDHPESSGQIVFGVEKAPSSGGTG